MDLCPGLFAFDGIRVVGGIIAESEQIRGGFILKKVSGNGAAGGQPSAFSFQQNLLSLGRRLNADR